MPDGTGEEQDMGNTSRHNMGTALVTGASSGIGAAFARELAARGYNLVLVARRKERLEKLAAELQTQHSITAEVLVADLSQPDEIERVEKRVALLETLTMLINNAGFSGISSFIDNDVSYHMDMIHVHVITTVRLTHAALKGMVSRGKGAIINVSSMSAFAPMPGGITYAATKTYLNVFTETLHHELKDTGVRVQVLCPGFTYTEIVSTEGFKDYDVFKIPSVFWMEAEDVVRESLTGLEKGRVLVIPGLLNRISRNFARIGLVKRMARWLVVSRFGFGP